MDAMGPDGQEEHIGEEEGGVNVGLSGATSGCS
jgi:hypothetical protein